MLIGVRRGPKLGRVLVTVLFTDIVTLLMRLLNLVDRKWHDLLDVHHRLVRRQLSGFHGGEIRHGRQQLPRP